MDTSRTIAVIDDDHAWVETLADYLRSRGLQVRTAVGGLRGLDLLIERDIGLAIVDWQMPDLDGLELIRRIRQLRPQTALFLLSSAEDPHLPARARAAGATGFLSKNEAPAAFLKALLDSVSHYFSESATTPLRKYLPAPPTSGAWLPAIRFQAPWSTN